MKLTCPKCKKEQERPDGFYDEEPNWIYVCSKCGHPFTAKESIDTKVDRCEECHSKNIKRKDAKK